MDPPLLVAITGASGAIYGVELLKALQELERPAHLIVSQAGRRTLELETDWALEQVHGLAQRVYEVDDLAAAVYGGRTGVSERRLARLPLARAARDLAAVAERAVHEATGNLWRSAR